MFSSLSSPAREVLRRRRRGGVEVQSPLFIPLNRAGLTPCRGGGGGVGGLIYGKEEVVNLIAKGGEGVPPSSASGRALCMV